jgi:hypothetical protein
MAPTAKPWRSGLQNPLFSNLWVNKNYSPTNPFSILTTVHSEHAPFRDFQRCWAQQLQALEIFFELAMNTSNCTRIFFVCWILTPSSFILNKVGCMQFESLTTLPRKWIKHYTAHLSRLQSACMEMFRSWVLGSFKTSTRAAAPHKEKYIMDHPPHGDRDRWLYNHPDVFTGFFFNVNRRSGSGTAPPVV